MDEDYIDQRASRLEPSDADNVKSFFICGIAQPAIDSDKGEALRPLLGGQQRSGEL